MTPPDPARIASGLTERECGLLMLFSADDRFLTPLGRAVRAALAGDGRGVGLKADEGGEG